MKLIKLNCEHVEVMNTIKKLAVKCCSRRAEKAIQNVLVK